MTKRALSTVLASATAMVLLAACGAGPGSGTGERHTIRVVAASSLTEAFNRLETTYEKQHRQTDVQLSFDSSAVLVEQLRQGLQADILATADQATMATAEAAGLLGARPVAFATNTLTIVTPAGNPAHISGLADLNNKTFAVCVQAAPCGAATESLFALNEITAKPATEEQNVKGVLTKVTFGEVDAGVVYQSDAHAAGDKVEVIAAENASEVVNVDPIAVLKTASDKRAARDWIALVTGPTGQKLLKSMGFGPRA